MKRITADEAFDRDIPVDQQENVLTEICEAAEKGCGQHGRVFILDVEHMDVINLRANGSITIGEKEFAFILANGNWNGTELLGWEDGGKQTFEHHVPTQYTLVPNASIIDDAIRTEKGNFLLWKWDNLMKRKEISDIPAKYMYDKHFQPGSLIEKHYEQSAKKYGFKITAQEYADEIRAKLLKANPVKETQT